MGLFAFVIIVWGLNYSFIKLGLTLSPPLWFAFLRVLTALPVAAALPFALKTKGRLSRKQALEAFLIGIPGSAIFFGFWTLATTQIQPGLVSVFIYTYPLWALFLSMPILKDFPSRKKTGAAFLGFFGVALTSQLGFVGLPTAELRAVAELVTAAFTFALMNVCFKRLFKGEQLIQANVWQLTGGLVTLGLWATLTTPVQEVSWNLGLLAVLIWVGAIGTAVVLAAFFTLMSRYNVVSLTAYLFLVVVVALVSSFFISGETISFVQAAGVAAIMVAIYLVEQSDRPRRQEPIVSTY